MCEDTWSLWQDVLQGYGDNHCNGSRSREEREELKEVFHQLGLSLLKRILVEVEVHGRAQVAEVYVLHMQAEVYVLNHQTKAWGRKADS